MSNKSLESLMYWFGPQPASLSFATGFRMNFGRWVEPNIQGVYVQPWTREDNMNAAREHALGYSVEGSVDSLTNPPVQIAMRQNQSPEFSWDFPDVKIHVDLETGKVGPNSFEFYSRWRNRPMFSDQGALARDMVVDLALHTDNFGENALSPIALHECKLLDMEASRPFLAGQTPATPSYKEKIVIPTADSVRIEEVDMKSFYSRVGNVVYYPAFREFVTCPQSWLYVPEKEAEMHIAARLKLNMEQTMQASRSILISHNYARLERMFSSSQLPLTYDAMVTLCKVILNR
jgi:hypothetical protein